MPQFKDAAGREWHPRVTVGTLQRYEEATSIPCLTAFAAAEGVKVGDPPAPEELAARAKAVHDALFRGRIGNVIRFVYDACSREADERRISFAAFCDGLSDVELMGAATAAAVEAFADFIRSPKAAP